MADIRISGPTFGQGIDSIAFLVGERVETHLPDGHMLAPPAESIRSHLAELLAAPTIDGFLFNSLRPTLSPSLSKPGMFTAAMHEASQAMASASTHDRENAPLLQRAQRLLDGDVALRGLVRAYYDALFQG